jgi:hypothetical protein
MREMGDKIKIMLWKVDKKIMSKKSTKSHASTNNEPLFATQSSEPEAYIERLTKLSTMNNFKEPIEQQKSN